MSTEQNHIQLESLFAKAIELHQQDKLEEALNLYTEILAHLPDSPLVNFNAGLAYYQLKYFDKSCSCYEMALIHSPNEPDILFNYALSLKMSDRIDETIQVYSELLRLKPDDIDAYYNLGCCYKDMNMQKKAICCFKSVLQRDKKHQSALSNIAYLYHREEEYDNALKFFLRLLSLNPDHISAQHMVASIRGEDLETASANYVEQIFDDYSDHFDRSLLENLKYSVPIQLRKIYDSVCSQDTIINRAIDIGCGTGLAAEHFHDVCQIIEGVDISAKMIKEAREKNIYTALHVSEISTYLKHCSSSYDLILAADVFTYIGDLETIFRLTHTIAAPHCIFCFSTEIDRGTHYSITKSGRFAHSETYIHNLANTTGWKIVEKRTSHIRKDNGKWVEGNLYIAQN